MMDRMFATRRRAATGAWGRLAGVALLSAGLATAAGVGPARADTITYVTTGQNADKEPLDALATFTTGNGTVAITLTNLISYLDVRSAGQAISDISFTLSSAPTGNATGTSTSGQLVTVNSDGTVTPVAGSPDRWIGSGHITTTGSTVLVEVLGGGKPSEMVLPTAGPNGYPNANSSITKNFSPYVDGSLTIDLSVPGVTAGTTVDAATFSFGTGPDTFLPGTPVVPEPSTIVTAAVGGIALLGGMWRRRNARRAKT